MRSLFVLLFFSCAAYQPLTVRAQVTKQKIITLSWAPNTEPDMAYYRIWIWQPWLGQRPTRSNQLIPHPLTSWTYVNLYQDIPNAKLSFAVTAIDTAGNESVLSDSVSVITDTSSVVVVIPDTIPPGKTQGLNLQVITVDTTKISF